MDQQVFLHVLRPIKADVRSSIQIPDEEHPYALLPGKALDGPQRSEDLDLFHNNLLGKEVEDEVHEGDDHVAHVCSYRDTSLLP